MIDNQGVNPLVSQLTKLLLAVDEEAECLRQRITQILDQSVLPEALLAKGRLDELIVNLRDANENLVLATMDAQDLQEKAEVAQSRQAVFLSTLAHELRNPLTPIALAAELLAQLGHVHPEIPMLQQIISRQTDHLTRLVDDLVDASRINNGKINIRKASVALSDIIQVAIETSKPLLDERDQRMVVNLPAQPVIIDGDTVRLTQVFSNLIVNASKFSPAGTTVRIAANRNHDQAVVTVSDEGMGIPAEMQPFVFDLFTQGSPASDPAHGGLGIGLALVRSIVELHEGTVSVRSDSHEPGTEFTVMLPALYDRSATEADKAVPAVAVHRQQKRILLIDDNPDINATLSRFLNRAGHTTTCASDGPSGLALASLHGYDAIICDIGLPGMDGFEVARKIRHRNPEQSCLIAITGYSEPTMRERLINAGFHRYLVKPVSGEALLRLIDAPLPDIPEPNPELADGPRSDGRL